MILAPAVVSPQAAAPPRAAASAGSDRIVVATILVAFVLLNPLGEIAGDGRIYMGRALADLDPTGIGRDLMFTLDGQSAFSVFRILARSLTAALGVERAAVVLTILDLAAWSSAVAILVRALVPGRAWILVLAATLLLPRGYTPWHLISAGESIPEPRPLAEAGVLLAMAALHGGRPWRCTGALTLSALIHPIMALPGFGIMLIVLGMKDRRWFAAAALCGIAFAAAGLLGAPLASRLLATLDPEWRAILVARNLYLFLGTWPIESLTPFVVRAATIALALAWLDGAARRIVKAACLVAVLGVVTSLVLGDVLSDVLVVQLQVWRALWLPTVLSTMAAGLCLVHLPSRGAGGQIALACLVLAWITIDDPVIAPLAALAAIGTYLVIPRLSAPPARTVVLAVWICCALVAGAHLWPVATAAAILIRTTPDGIPVRWQTLCSLRLLLVPSVALAFAWWHWRDRRTARTASVAVLGLGLVLLPLVWDGRNAPQARRSTIKPDLVALLATREGEVLWTEGDEGWYWAGRPNWNSPIQGSALVFSREQAVLWARRTREVVEAGLATGYLVEPWRFPSPIHPPALDTAKIGVFCARKGAPAWIVTPLDGDMVVPEALGGRVWSAHETRGKLVSNDAALRWQPLDRYAVIPCATRPAARP